MKQILIVLSILSFLCFTSFAQEQHSQYDPSCSTPELDSASAVGLPWYANNQILNSHLIQNGYNDLEQITFPNGENARSSNSTFLEPNYLIPLNLYIYRYNNSISTSINENGARNYVCEVNEIYRNAGSGIQFYVNRVEFENNNFFNQEITKAIHVYDMWSRKRLISDPSRGVNIHFIRYNGGNEESGGKASLPALTLPYAQYSLYVRTHDTTIPNGALLQPYSIIGTFAHELGHTLGLLHTHHPGRLP